MRNTKRFLAVVFFVFIVFSLAGCNQEGAVNTPGTAQPTDGDSTDTPHQGGGVTIRYYSMWNETENQAEVIKAAAEEYENDTGNHVEIIWVGRETDQTIRTELEAGENCKVDICGGECTFTRTYMDFYTDLTEYAQRPYDSLGGKTLEECMNPTLVKVMKEITGGDELYAIPYQPYAILFLYNQDHFDEIGASVPTTWDEFLDVCQKLKDAGHIPMTTDDAYRDLLLGYSLARMKGVEYVSKMMNDKSLWDDEGVLQALRVYEDLAQRGYLDSTASSNVWPAGQNEVGLGNVSIYLTGTWLPNELVPVTGADFRWGAFNFPTLSGQIMGVNSAMFGASTFNIPKTSKVKDEAFEFITYLVNPKYDQMMAQETAGIPLAPDGQWPEIMEGVKPAFDAVDGFIEKSGGLSANNDTKTLALSEFGRLIGGEITSEQFIQNMMA